MQLSFIKRFMKSCLKLLRSKFFYSQGHTLYKLCVYAYMHICDPILPLQTTKEERERKKEGTHANDLQE